MKTRIITSVVGLAILGLVLLTFNTALFNIIVAIVALIATHEIYMAVRFEKKDLALFLVQIPYVLLIMNSQEGLSRALVLPASFVLMLFYCVYLVLAMGRVSFLRTSGFIAFSAVVMFCFYSIVTLKALLPMETYSYDALFFIVVCLCFAWGGDSCAYFAGRFFGKHKLIPKVSPKKTVEGAIGGVIGSMAFGIVATLLYQQFADRVQSFQTTNLGVSMVVVVAVLGVFAAVLGIFGDLFASVVKRQCELKDYGSIFPGHGGILDRFDSVMFIAPFVTIVITTIYCV